MTWDLIVIGGGAAGFFGAIAHAEAGGGSTLILEKTSHLLQKVKISGGGRCNVTHQCLDPKELAKNYPRGHRSLIGPLHRWNAQDTINWFESRGVELKTEADGRMFPVTNDSQTIIDCLNKAASDSGVQVKTRRGITSIRAHDEDPTWFTLESDSDETFHAKNILLATGGTRLNAGAVLAESLGHELIPPTPSLFTFKITHPLLTDLPGLSVAEAAASIPTVKVDRKPLRYTGPTLITHWGLSGPGILKLSAWGATELAKLDYQFTLHLNWLPRLTSEDISEILQKHRLLSGKKQSHSQSLFPEIPKRLWSRMLQQSGVPSTQTWSQMTKEQSKDLLQLLTDTQLPVAGKSINKDEFVTAGGVQLKNVNLKTMESKIRPNLYFAGEVLNIDGITGGFNFQNAWTTAHLAASAIAEK